MLFGAKNVQTNVRERKGMRILFAPTPLRVENLLQFPFVRQPLFSSPEPNTLADYLLES